METVITRDTDIIREYMTILAAQERAVSPFAQIAATIKLAQLRSELDATQLESTDEDIANLRREINNRINRTFLRRFMTGKWGSRIGILFTQVIAQQVLLLLILLANMLFVSVAPVPKWWNPVLPHDEYSFLYVFIFVFYFATALVAVLTVFGGRFFSTWKKTLPLILLITILSTVGTYLVVRRAVNPVRRSSSVMLFARQLGFGDSDMYRQWVEASWLLKDAKFRSDYETYLRNGPGRWITSRFAASDDSAWTNSLTVMEEYVTSGQDIEGLREWMHYYLDKNRIYSEDRIEREVNALTGEANQLLLGIWQVEPYLKERDQRMYRAYLGLSEKRLILYGLAWLGLLTLSFLIGYLFIPFVARLYNRPNEKRQTVISPIHPPVQPSLAPSISDSMANEATEAHSFVEEQNLYDDPPAYALPRSDSSRNWFPEKSGIQTLPFFDTPFEMFSRVHRKFLKIAVFSSILVFAFWAAFLILTLASQRNPSTQAALMGDFLLLPNFAEGAAMQSVASPPGHSSPSLTPSTLQEESTPATQARLQDARQETLLTNNLFELYDRLDEGDYQFAKQRKSQLTLLTGLRSDLSALRSMTSEFQQTTAGLPNQLAELNSRASAAEARAGQAIGELSGTRQKADDLESQINAKLTQLDQRASRVADQIGRVEEQASLLATRTEALEKELDRRARQIEARTEELGERTAALNERDDRLTRLQRAAFNAILSGLKTEVDEIERRTQVGAARPVQAPEARAMVAAITQRMKTISDDLRDINTDPAKQLLAQLEELSKRVEQIAARIR